MKKPLTGSRLSATNTAHTKYEKNKDMKTKSLLAAGLLMAATAASSVAQTVYSVNAVGFVNKTFPASGFTLAANPLDATVNTVTALFPGVAEGSQIFTFNPSNGGFDVNTFAFGVWGSPNNTLVPGQGFFFKNASSTAYTATFVGNVQQSTAGPLNVTLNAGFSLVSSRVPQQGLVSTDLGFPKIEGDIVFKFNPSTISYEAYTFVFGTWNGPGGALVEPTIDVAEGFFSKKAAGATWSRTFSVN